MRRLDLHDLAHGPIGTRELVADVCVIGAGAAGIYLSKQLADRGVHVVLVEAGSAQGVDSETMGFTAEFTRERYSGATNGRYFGMGGSTSRWGGVVVPYSWRDRRAGQPWGEAWDRIVSVVERRAPEVLDRLGYKRDEHAAPGVRNWPGELRFELSSDEVVAETAWHMPFSRRNLSSLLEGSPEAAKRPLIVVNAVARTWGLVEGSDGEARLQQVEARSQNGNSIRVKATRFVVAAGAIESARIALEINECGDRPAFRRGAAIGSYLSDHLSLPIGDVEPRSRQFVVTRFAPRFACGWMGSARFFRSTPNAQGQRHFAHFIFDGPVPGFELAKELLGAVQRRRRPSISGSKALAGAVGLLSLGYARFVHKRLHLPADTPSHMQLDIEQVPRRENGVSLGDTLDRHGRRIPRIHWSVSNEDLEAAREAGEELLRAWGHGADVAIRPLTWGQSLAKPHDAYHPVGTCRMGVDREAVVDTNLKAWGIENLWIASTGVIPSAGSANPTFSLLCLTHELAEHLVGLNNAH